MQSSTPDALRKAAEELRSVSERMRSQSLEVKTASEREELDPKAVLDFLAFYRARQ